MEILIYQISIIAIICFSALFGRNVRKLTMLCIAIFTIFQVFVMWLGVLQFITIFIGYLISDTFLNDPNRREERRKEREHAQYVKKAREMRHQAYLNSIKQEREKNRFNN